jgi:hypothetical protein
MCADRPATVCVVGEFDHIVAALQASPVWAAFKEMTEANDFSRLESSAKRRLTKKSRLPAPRAAPTRQTPHAPQHPPPRARSRLRP